MGICSIIEKAGEVDAKFKAEYEQMLGKTEESRKEAEDRMLRLVADEERAAR